MSKLNAKGKGDNIKTIASNRKARHLYFIEEEFEAGLVLVGTEVKSLREGRANLGDAFARIVKGEAWLENCHISEYAQGNIYNHNPTRPRKLLLNARELRKLSSKIKERGYTLVALSLYFSNGRAKCELALAKGKKLYDKRDDAKERDANREMDRARREKSRSIKY